MIESGRRRGPVGEARTRLLSILRASSEPMTTAALARATGLHPNSVRDHLAHLVRGGLATRQTGPAAGRGRPAVRYAADAEATAAAEDPRPYAHLAAVLANELTSLPDGALVATRAGERWGQAVAADLPTAPDVARAMTSMVDILAAAGFAPETAAGALGPVGLRRCPFGRLAVGREPVVCGVHLGLMRGALSEMRAPVEATRLEPFVEPDRCLAHFEARADG